MAKCQKTSKGRCARFSGFRIWSSRNMLSSTPSQPKHRKNPTGMQSMSSFLGTAQSLGSLSTETLC